jgi:hypothetical protein
MADETPTEFLKRTTGRGTGQETPEQFLARTAPTATAPTAITAAPYSEYGDLAAQPWAQGTPPADDSYAPVLSAGKRVIDATAEGFKTGMAGRTDPEALAAQEAFNRGNLLNTWIVTPAMKLAGGVMGATGAGIGQTIYEAGNALDPRLGRDLVMLSQVAPMAHIGTGVPTVPPEPNPLARPAFVSERTAPPRAPGMTDAERIRQLIQHDTASETGEPPPSPAPPNSAGDVHAGEAPSPQSGGAAATPGGDIPDQTRVERARNLRVSINETARDRAGPDLVDDRAYVTTLPNSPDPLPPRMRPERDFNPQTALDHKERYGEDASGYRADYDANHAARNTGMRDLLENDAGTELTLDQLRTARRDVAPDAFGAFEGEQPVDASGFRARVQRVLESPEGKRKAVERTLNDVLAQLHDREGNLETMPSTLYGVRKHIDDLIEKARKGTDREGTDAAASVHILRDLAPEMDDLIQSGAGRYQAYRDAYREASQPVNQQRFLQQYQGGTKRLWDSEGNLQKDRLDRMLEDIHKGLSDTKFNLAQSLTDEQIQNIINVRNELAARQLRDAQAKVPGSPTVQLLNQAAKRGTGPLAKTLKNVGELAAHGAAAYVEGGPSLLNAPIAAYTVTRHLREARKAARAQGRLDEQTNALRQRLLSQEPVNPLSLYDQ